MRTALGLGVALVLGGCFSESAPDGDGSDDTTDGGSTTTASTTTSTAADASSSTTDVTDGTTAAGECTAEGAVDQACEPATPYCVDATCHDCGTLPSGCAAIDTTSPICDEATQLCTACTEHDQCESGACRVKTGECFASSNRLWVDAAADCVSGMGTQAAPFCTIDEAITTIGGQATAEPWAVFVAGSAIPYAINPDSPPATPIAVVGPSQGADATITGMNDPLMRITGPDRELYLARLTLDSSNTVLVDCGQGELWLHDALLRFGSTLLAVGGQCEARARRCSFTDASGRAVEVSSGGSLALVESSLSSNQGGMLVEGNVTIARSTVTGSWTLGGVDVPQGSLSVTNAMLWGNAYDFGNLRVSGSASVQLLYVTILGTPGSLADVACIGNPPSLTVRNSAIQDIGCPQAIIDDSLVTASAVGQGDNNTAFPTLDAEINAIFDDWYTDPHLEDPPPEQLLGIAIRRAADPAVDIDGDPRPGVDQPDYPGADHP